MTFQFVSGEWSVGSEYRIFKILTIITGSRLT